MRNRIYFTADQWLRDEIRTEALRDGRTDAGMGAVLVREALYARRGMDGQRNVGAAQDDGVASGATVAAHVPRSVVDGIRSVATTERRSVSSSIRMLLKESLRARGLLSLVHDSTKKLAAA